MTLRYLPFIFGTSLHEEVAFVTAYAASVSASQSNQRQRGRSHAALSLVVGLFLFVVVLMLYADQAMAPGFVLFLLIAGIVSLGVSLGLFAYAQTTDPVTPDVLLKGFWRLVVVPADADHVLVWDTLSYTTATLTSFSVNGAEIQEQIRRLTLPPVSDLAGEIEMLDKVRQKLHDAPRRQAVVAWLPGHVLKSLNLPLIWGQTRPPRRTDVDHDLIVLDTEKRLEIVEICALSSELIAFANQDLQGQLAQIRSQLIGRFQQMSRVIAQGTGQEEAEESGQSARLRVEAEQQLYGAFDSMFATVSDSLQEEIGDKLKPLKRQHDQEVDNTKWQQTRRAAELQGLQQGLRRAVREAERDYNVEIGKLRRIDEDINLQLAMVSSLWAAQSEYTPYASAAAQPTNPYDPEHDEMGEAIAYALATLQAIIYPTPQPPTRPAQLQDDISGSSADRRRHAQELIQRLDELKRERDGAVHEVAGARSAVQEARRRMESVEQQFQEYSRVYGADATLSSLEAEYTRKRELIEKPVTRLKEQQKELHEVWQRAGRQPAAARSAQLTPQRVADRMRADQLAALNSLQKRLDEVMAQRLVEHRQVSDYLSDARCAATEFSDATQILLPVWFYRDAKDHHWHPLLAGGRMHLKPCPPPQGEALCLDGVSQGILDYFTRHMNDEILGRAFNGAEPITNERRDAVQKALQRLRDSGSISVQQFGHAQTMLGKVSLAWLARQAVPLKSPR